MRVVLAICLSWSVWAGCGSRVEPSTGATGPGDTGPATTHVLDAAKAALVKPPLLPALEDELVAIRAEPDQSVGFGDKAYQPYYPNVATSLINVDDPVVTERLLAEVRDSSDRVFRLALLHVLGRRVDLTVDDALVSLLDEPDLRATAAYLLGAVNMKGQPKRARDAATIAKILAALRPWLGDDTEFDDPFYRETYRVGDFALGAFVRTAGPERFQLSGNEAVDDLIGFALPRFDAQARVSLLTQAASIE